jgi:hypothetical protein
MCFSSRYSDGSLICDRGCCDGECLTCGGFSLGETVRLGNFEFITDYFSGLSLSPRIGDTGATFMGSTHSGTSIPWRAMIEDFAQLFLMVSCGEGSFDFPSPRRHGTGASLAPVTTMPLMEDAPAAQAMMTVPLRMTVLHLEIGLSFERRHAHHRGR